MTYTDESFKAYAQAWVEKFAKVKAARPKDVRGINNRIAEKKAYKYITTALYEDLHTQLVCWLADTETTGDCPCQMSEKKV